MIHYLTVIEINLSAAASTNKNTTIKCYLLFVKFYTKSKADIRISLPRSS